MAGIAPMLGENKTITYLGVMYNEYHTE